MRGRHRKRECRTCAVLGRFQRGPVYWLLRRHLSRMGQPRHEHHCQVRFDA